MFYQSINRIIVASLLCASPMSYAQTSNNETVPPLKQSKTISYPQNSTLKLSEKTALLKQAETDVISADLQNSLRTTQTPQARHTDFNIYDATTELISDFDNDGFYHRFSVTIDADTLFDHAEIYADFYLSFEGGPWIYYASSENYLIRRDNENDAFTVETELADGYPTGYYDMKIKLYDSRTDEYLLTYDQYQDHSLSAIPLEDSYRDDYYYNDIVIFPEVIVSYGAGSTGFILLLLLPILFLKSKLKKL